MSGTLALLAAVVVGILILIAAAGSTSKPKKKEPPRENPEEILVRLVMELLLKEDYVGALAMFCVYRAMTTPEKRALTSVMVAEVDRRFGTRVPWPAELRVHVKMLLDDFYADELSRIELDIQNFKTARAQCESRDLKQAELATKMSGW